MNQSTEVYTVLGFKRKCLTAVAVIMNFDPEAEHVGVLLNLPWAIDLVGRPPHIFNS